MTTNQERPVRIWPHTPESPGSDSSARTRKIKICKSQPFCNFNNGSRTRDRTLLNYIWFSECYSASAWSTKRAKSSSRNVTTGQSFRLCVSRRKTRVNGEKRPEIHRVLIIIIFHLHFIWFFASTEENWIWLSWKSIIIEEEGRKRSSTILQSPFIP